jgi:hypothetical protein
LTQSEFEEELDEITSSVKDLEIYIGMATRRFKERDIAGLISILNSQLRFASLVQMFIEKYDRFLEVVEKKFNIQLSNPPKVLRTKVIEVKTAIGQIKLNFAQKKFDIAGRALDEIEEKVANLKLGFDELSVLPQELDYSLLSNQDWRLIGIAGIHYKAKVFLSYPWRDKDSRKDENEILISSYVKPIFETLGIIAVTLRDKLQAQDDMTQKDKELILDADGIMGFYTKGDSMENIEYELSLSDNVVAILTELGAKSPSMRRSKWQLEFNRDETGDLVLKIMRALKDKEMFRLIA